ncbi:sensor histidine kinase [Yinghuangia sp. YIM S10712]|uniref:sensor histidine kinase n=1 Tax=Yinghuangia sp. YIM S10712 TaxID=3436930 RepID=UPI003F53AFFA
MAAPGLKDTPSGRTAWTTRRWLTAGVVGSLIVLLVLGSLGAWALYRASEATDRLTDRESPALIEALRLEKALLNQETGVRGYALAGRPDYLEPYRRGVAEEQDSVAVLRGLIAGTAAEGDLDAVLDKVAAWQVTTARPIVETAPGIPGGAGTQTAEATNRLNAGKDSFDAVRSSAAALQDRLQDNRQDAAGDLHDAQQLRDLLLAAIAVVIVALAVLVSEGFRRGVTVPLERLGADVRRISDGDFDHGIDTTGPADLRALANDVEGMRRRLIDELVFADLARRRLDEQSEDLRRSNAELEQFAYVASHDLQEPLRKVASFCQLLQRRYAGNLDERADQYIEFAVDGANRMQRLINDLLAFSRVGRTRREHETVDLERTFADAVDNLSIAAEESGAVITHDPMPTLTADPTQMVMLWQNLLGNAVKFRDPESPPRIHVSVTAVDDERVDGSGADELAQAAEHVPLWRFTVTDNGIGIDPEYAERVFVIFQRLHAKDAYPGTGIGLAMCKKIVEFHGGTIAVDTGHSPGTSISFTLPADGGSEE